MTESTEHGLEILQDVDADRIRDLRQRGAFFWLDLTGPSDADLTTLGELVAIHPLALEDSREFGQRVKLDDYPHSALLVSYGAQPRTERPGRPRMVEVHLHVSDGALVTVTREPLSVLTDARHHVAADAAAHGGHAIYGVLDALADSFLDTLAPYDGAIDDLQEALAEHATTAHRRRIFELRRQLAEMRQVVVPQRDLFASGGDLIDTVPGLNGDRAAYGFRDIHDHLTRAAGLIDTYREQLGGLLDLYLTEVSNRLNIVMKRLTLIATVFLPLTFLTGFFGMNFNWLLQNITPLWAFLAFGVGLPLVSAAGLALYLKQTGSR